MGGIRVKWTAFTLFYYGANAVWQGYMSLFYRQLGFLNGQIGLISAAMSVCVLAAQPFWGRLADQSRFRNRLLAVPALLSACVLPLALVSGSFLTQLIFACLFYAFYCALLPMGDAVLLDALNRQGLSFGPYRLAGAAAFAATGALFGRLSERAGSRSVVWCASALLLAASASALLLPPGARRDRRKSGFAKLFQNRDLMILLAFMIPVQMTMGYFYTFFATHFAQLRGGNASLLGLGYALATLSEVPYLLLSDQIFRRFGAAKPMCLSALVMGLRWLILGLGKNSAIALASQLLHGGGFIVMTVSMAKYIAQNVDENLRASGQMLLSMASFGVARVAGNLGGGFLADRIGSFYVFLISSAVCLVSAACFAKYAFRRRS